MTQILMYVSPVVFSEMQEKVAECWAETQIWPYDQFVEWARKTFGCVAGETYRVIVVWEWKGRNWNFAKEITGNA